MIQTEDMVAAGAVLHQRGTVTAWQRFAYDSRLAQAGDLFVALKTERADGHGFIAEAVAAGASGVLCIHPPAHLPASITVLTTGDVLATTSRWASLRVRAVAPTIVAVTGSVGKTSTKRAIATLLGADGPLFSSPRSFNSPLGLSVALTELRDEDRWAVLEFGADRRGEISQLATLFPPHVGVVTAIGAAHLAAFGTLDGVAREKGALIRALPSDGWAVLNGDDPLVRTLAHHTQAWVLTYGSGPHCDVWCSNVTYQLDGTTFDLNGHSDGETPDGTTRTGRDTWSVTVQIQPLGLTGVQSALAAVAAAIACQIPLETIIARLPLIEPAPGRLRPLRAHGGATLIDDSFNAAPPSMLAALDTLRNLPARRRIAILGEMSQLGEASAYYHEQIGRQAALLVDVLITKGDRATLIAAAAREAAEQAGRSIQITPVYTAASAIAALPADLGPGDVVLVKGSAEARMERVAAGLLAADVPPDAALVRQERAWRRLRIGTPDRPTTLRIDLDALAHNARRLRELIGVPLMAVLKADAYGHGAIRAARTVLLNGATMLAVATLSEALLLRTADIAAPILILGYTPPWQVREAVAGGITCTIFDDETAQALQAAAAGMETVAQVHIKVDTGMIRLGLAPDAVPAFIERLGDLPNVRVEGMFTHFATADEEDSSFLTEQWTRFNTLLSDLERAGVRPPTVHAANSAAGLRYPQTRYDVVRAGIALYGLDSSAAAPAPADLLPVMSFHTEIAQVRTVPAGTPISYGGLFVTPRPAVIATIPVGYADGFRRAPAAWQAVLVNGRRAPVVGRVCMDYTMIDVTDCGAVGRGDPVVLIGVQGDDEISAEQVAEWLGTSNYEVVSAILPRVPRESLEEG